jgi:hypothetical protein
VSSCGAKLSFTKPKTYVPGFSPKYFTIWGRNMDTKRTTGKQITGNRWIFGEDLLENKGKKRSEMSIREIMEVGKNILEVIEGTWLRWFGHVKTMPGKRLPLKILEWEPEGT